MKQFFYQSLIGFFCLTSFFFTVNAKEIAPPTLCETNGLIEKVFLDESGAHFQGWVMSMETAPISGFKVEYGNESIEIQHSPIFKKENFFFTIPLNSELSNRLIKVSPLIGKKKGQPLFFVYQPLLPIPSQVEADAVGRGDFLSVGFHILSLLEGRGDLKKTDKILDVGCGLGRVAYPLAYYLSPHATYEGFDVDPSLIVKAQLLINPYFGNFHFQHADVYNSLYNPFGKIPSALYTFPYPSSTFDFVFLTSVFTHMLPSDVQHYLSEIQRVLKPGGRCLLTCFLLNDESKFLLSQGKSVIPFIFPITDCVLMNPTYPEAAVAYEQNLFSKWISEHQFTIKSIHLGEWCGRSDKWVSFQDLMVIEKPKSAKF